MQKSLSISQALSFAFTSLFTYLPQLFMLYVAWTGIYIASALFSAFLALLSAAIPFFTVLLIPLIAVAFCFAFIQPAYVALQLVRLALAAKRNQSPTIDELFNITPSLLFKVTFIYWIRILITFMGSLLFLVPGI